MQLKINLLKTSSLPIKEQLALEEALLRTSDENWILLNTGSPPAIVMGISGKPEELIHIEQMHCSKIPLIKRFSGGGTVVVDEQTLFATFIFNKGALPLKEEPRAIMKWTEGFLAPFFKDLPFALRENDYVLGEKKFGGNAQYIQRGRWLHHTSFLWDYCPSKMELLKLPKRRPEYRADRCHSDFLTCLKEYYPCKEQFLEELSRYFQESLQVKEVSLEEVLPHLEKPHRKATLHLA